jgi:hypothetical protein
MQEPCLGKLVRNIRYILDERLILAFLRGGAARESFSFCGSFSTMRDIANRLLTELRGGAGRAGTVAQIRKITNGSGGTT